MATSVATWDGVEAGEEWRSLPGTSYEVSDLGRVRRGLKILKDRPHPKGYRIVDICVDGKATSKTVHGLVAGAFLPPKPPGHEVNHEDGNKGNNRASNLNWKTPKGNTAHAIRTGLRRGRQAVSPC